MLRVANKEESVQCIQRALANEDGPVRDIVLLNAGATLYAANVADSLVDGIEKAEAVLDSGAARAKLDAFVSTTQALGA